MPSSQELAWLAGLLEGEGSFETYQGKRVCPCIRVTMTDRDVVARAATFFGNERLGDIAAHDNKQRLFRTTVYGVRAVSWMMTLYRFMGERRRKQIRKALTAWKASPRRPYMTANVMRLKGMVA